jgi:hypothetical protein
MYTGKFTYSEELDKENLESVFSIWGRGGGGGLCREDVDQQMSLHNSPPLRRSVTGPASRSSHCSPKAYTSYWLRYVASHTDVTDVTAAWFFIDLSNCQDVSMAAHRSQSSTSRREGPVSITGAVHVGVVAERVALGQIILPWIRFPLPIISSLKLHTNLAFSTGTIHPCEATVTV